ncbi:nucleoside hydrolase [Bacillus sp. FJAT-18017]|uniref:nucleoside hydrolase n=1 Tax=Bacillus sp. FJAT-18017 TaxID=1705566 RepID=UPI0006AFCBCA|nr:nucleoside hydrolase [Bacillus sp. FJAT-18017]ALC88993.1 nucleoside hydrolase [Bacillus sp. FJAT-18017]
MTEKVILDVDTGIDDAMAIIYAARAKEIELLGLTTCFGNTSVEETTRNTLQLLELLGREDIPVSMGADTPWKRAPLKEKAVHIHGEDGMGNHSLPLPKIEATGKHAVDVIIENVLWYPGEVTLIFVGSLTNLALAIEKEPAIIEKVRRVVVMGGAATVKGNITPHAEANIYTDPEAADFVFQSGVPVTMVGLDVTMQTLLPKGQLETWRTIGTPLSEFLYHIVGFYMNAYLTQGIAGCALHDPLAVGAVIDPSFIKTKPMHIRVDCSESDTIGETVSHSGEAPNIEVALEVDADRFRQHFLSLVN